MGYQSSTDGLASLEPPNATIPEIRVKDAGALQNMLRRLIDNDAQGGRSYKRSRVQALVDGNNPYSSTRLANLGRKDACNVNWGSARSYMQSAEGIFFDLSTEAPTQLIIHTSHGTQEKKVEWSQNMTEVAHEVLNSDPKWNYVRQCSQHQMVIQGCGPLWFDKQGSVVPRRANAGDLMVPDNAESETSYWELAFVLVDYKVHELFEFIEDEQAASRIGWRVDYAKQVLMNALPKPQQPGAFRRWEEVQNEFKKNSFVSYFGTDVLQLAHAYWKEFDGTITHAIIEQTNQGSNPPVRESDKSESSTQYLFCHRGRFNEWQQVIHPMYYDKGNGEHYSVTGMGIPMYGAMNIENRLRCNLVDKAMAPKMLFKPTQEGNKPFGLKVMADYAVMQAGFDLQPFGMQGMMEDGMVMLQEVQRTASSNLAQYRSGFSREQIGNPITAKEAGIKQQQQYAVANTSIARYYEQLDGLFTEMVRRMCDLNTSDPLARKFQERCTQLGVPRECFGRIEKVEANRVVGAGSSSLRQQALDKIMGLLGRLPENGQDNLIEQWIAAHAGRRAVDQFYPRRKDSGMATEQQAEAMLQVAGIKVGVPPVLTPQQNPGVFAATFIGAAGQAVGTLSQGANPMEIIRFVDLAVSAGMAHMTRLKDDPTRQPLFKQLQKMIKQLETVIDGLKKKLSADAKKRQSQKGNGSQLPPEIAQKLAIEDAKGKLKLRQMEMSHGQRMKQRAEQHAMENQASLQRTNVETASADLRTAAEIKRSRLKSLSE